MFEPLKFYCIKQSSQEWPQLSKSVFKPQLWDGVSLLKQSKYLDPPYKTDLDFMDCFERPLLAVVLNLTTLWDSISVYIEQSPSRREKEKRYDRAEKKCLNDPPPAPTVSTVGTHSTIIQTSKAPGSEGYPPPSPDQTTSCLEGKTVLELKKCYFLQKSLQSWSASVFCALTFVYTLLQMPSWFSVDLKLLWYWRWDCLLQNERLSEELQQERLKEEHLEDQLRYMKDNSHSSKLTARQQGKIEVLQDEVRFSI